MKHIVIAAIILTVGLIVAAFLYGGRYYFVRLDQCTISRGDRWTGEVKTIPTTASKACEWNF